MLGVPMVAKLRRVPSSFSSPRPATMVRSCSPVLADSHESLFTTLIIGCNCSACQRLVISAAKSALSATMTTDCRLTTRPPKLRFFQFVDRAQQTLCRGCQVDGSINVLRVLGLRHFLLHHCRFDMGGIYELG